MKQHLIAAGAFALLAMFAAGCSEMHDQTVKSDGSVSTNTSITQPNQDATMSYPGIAATAKPVVTTSGLQYIDIVEGAGATPKPGDHVSVHYTGYLKDGYKFDSSVDRGQPFSFTIGRGQVIKGWDEGVMTMKIGGKRKLIIPAELGYGSRGAGSVIPPNSLLIFDVELLGLN